MLTPIKISPEARGAALLRALRDERRVRVGLTEGQKRALLASMGSHADAKSWQRGGLRGPGITVSYEARAEALLRVLRDSRHVRVGLSEGQKRALSGGLRHG